jgi:uncharacterized protein YdaU (DUF1376 family)
MEVFLRRMLDKDQERRRGSIMARKKPPSFDFFADDFIAGTYHMEAEAVGIYIRLLCYQWSNGSIPDDEPTLCKIAGVDANALRTHMRSVMRKLCVGNAGELYNERLEIERAKKLEIIEKAKRSAEQRWSKENKGNPKLRPESDGCERNANAYANAMPTQCSLLPTSNVLLPNTNNPLPPKGTSKAASLGEWDIPDGFDTPEVRQALSDFEAMRASIGKKIKSRANVSKSLRGYDSPSHLVYAIEFAIGNEYQGIKPEYRPSNVGQGGYTSPKPKKSTLPIIDENWEPA